MSSRHPGEGTEPAPPGPTGPATTTTIPTTLPTSGPLTLVGPTELNSNALLALGGATHGTSEIGEEHHVFNAADGAQLHDAPVAPQRRNEVVLDWLDDVLR